MNRNITIKTIAADLGVSHMTVSRALTGSTSIRPDTRDRIVNYAAKLGYVPNAAAEAMRSGVARIVGLLVPNLTNEFYARLADSLAQLYGSTDFSLIIHVTGDDVRSEHQALRRLHQQNAHAAIVVPAPGTSEPIPGLNVPVFHLIRTSAPDGHHPTLYFDEGPSIAAAVDHLSELGHSNIAFIGGSESLSSARRRLKAYRTALERHSIQPNGTLIQTGPPRMATGRAAMQSILDLTPRASAVICGGVELSNGALEYCMEHRIKFPDDIAFVGFGDPTFYTWSEGGISTLSLPIEEMARRAFKAVSAIREAGFSGSEWTSRVPTRLLLRRSA